jgi:RimJ/RimL family protein N-acetyltransferase
LLSRYSSSLRSFNEESFKELKRIPKEMNPRSLAHLAAHPHGFQTGTKNRPGRLILHNVLEKEIQQFRRVLTAPENNNYPGAQAQDELDDLDEEDLQSYLFDKDEDTERQIWLMIVLKPGLEVSMEMPFKRVPHMVNSGHVIGFATLVLDQHPRDHSDCGAYTGIMIHHEARRHKFAKEALIAVLDYILLGEPRPLRNGNLAGLGLLKAHIETGMENEAFRKLMEELHLKHLEREATPDHGQDYRMKVPCVNYTVTKPVWLEARKHIILDWMPEGQQALSRDGTPDLHVVEHGQASGAGHPSGSGHASGSGHITGNERFAYGSYK